MGLTSGSSSSSSQPNSFLVLDLKLMTQYVIEDIEKAFQVLPEFMRAKLRNQRLEIQSLLNNDAFELIRALYGIYQKYSNHHQYVKDFPAPARGAALDFPELGNLIAHLIKAGLFVRSESYLSYEAHYYYNNQIVFSLRDKSTRIETSYWGNYSKIEKELIDKANLSYQAQVKYLGRLAELISAAAVYLEPFRTDDRPYNYNGISSVYAQPNPVNTTLINLLTDLIKSELLGLLIDKFRECTASMDDHLRSGSPKFVYTKEKQYLITSTGDPQNNFFLMIEKYPAFIRKYPH